MTIARRLCSALLPMLFLLLTAWPGSAQAQEFNCTVSVNYSQLSGSDYTYLNELRDEMLTYINMQSWTDDRYLEQERIDCSIQITLLEAPTLTSFRARLVVVSRRPIYGTTQSSVVLQINDEDWRFDYAQGTPMITDLDRYDPLTSVINFYLYVILGYDYDTFDQFGGTPYFEKARLIADLGQSSGTAGWAALGGDQNRGSLIAELLDPRFRVVRQAYFDYHYGALDRFAVKTDDARDQVMRTLDELYDLNNEVARSYLLDLFFGTKYRELVSIFQDSPVANQAYDILTEVDPAHLSDYTRIIE